MKHGFDGSHRASNGLDPKAATDTTSTAVTTKHTSAVDRRGSARVVCERARYSALGFPELLELDGASNIDEWVGFKHAPQVRLEQGLRASLVGLVGL